MQISELYNGISLTSSELRAAANVYAAARNVTYSSARNAITRAVVGGNVTKKVAAAVNRAVKSAKAETAKNENTPDAVSPIKQEGWIFYWRSEEPKPENAHPVNFIQDATTRQGALDVALAWIPGGEEYERTMGGNEENILVYLVKARYITPHFEYRIVKKKTQSQSRKRKREAMPEGYRVTITIYFASK